MRLFGRSWVVGERRGYEKRDSGSEKRSENRMTLRAFGCVQRVIGYE